jgi:hypothetical protein
MVNISVTGEIPLLINVPAILFPDPFIGIPVRAAVFLIHENVVPTTLLNRLIEVIGLPEQIVCDETLAVTFGVGLTITVTVIGVAVQPFAEGVIVNVAV